MRDWRYLKYIQKNIPLSNSVDLEKLADLIKCVGADIKSICIEAVMLALRDELKKTRHIISSNIMEYY